MSASLHRPVALVFDERLTAYNFGPTHPMQPSRLVLTVALLRALGLLDGPDVRVIPPLSATAEELCLVHAPPYVEVVQALSADPDAAFGALRTAADAAGLTQSD